VKEKKLVY